MRANILSKIICDTYEMQFRRMGSPNYGKAMKITFVAGNHDKAIELLLIWEGYVGVFERTGIEWNCLSCHDSCWRGDGVEDFVNKYYDEINWVHGLFNWFEIIEITPESDEKFRKLERGRFD